MTMDFSGSAGAATAFDLIPNGQLAFAVLQVKALKTSGSGSRYLDVELTIDAGQPYAGRKVFDKIGDPFFEGNSEKYRAMGQVAITRILETARGASPNNPAGYKLNNFEELSGARVAIKIGVEGGTDGHEDKNRVSEWLTPNPASQSGHKHYAKLVAGEFNASSKPAQQAASGFGSAPAAQGGQTTGGFGTGGTAAPAQQPQASGFGNSGSGFPQPSAPGSAAAEANAASATGQSTTGFASTESAPKASPSEQTPGWLAQAGAQAQG